MPAAPAALTVANPDLWLTDAQQAVWRAWLLGSARISAHLDAVLRPHGLDLADYEILVCLSESDDRSLRMSTLADMAHQSRSRLTHAVSRMERGGYVTRRPAKDDGRGVIATLTDAGYALLDAVAPTHVQSVRDIFVDAVDSDDFAAIGRAMQAVLSAKV